MTQAFRDLVQIGITLTSERNLATLLERILSEGRRFTHAEAGTLFLREGDLLRFAVVQNERLARELGEDEMRRRLQEEPLQLRELSLAGHVALTGDILNLHDTYAIPPDRPYSFDPRVDARLDYRTQSILVVPLQDPAGNILGVLEDLSFKDALTDVYNRRYFMVRMEEEFKRHTRFVEPLALALVDLDHFKDVNDRFGHRTGDEALRDVARLLLKHSRSFSVVTRYGGDEFAIILVNTGRLGALTYGERIRAVVEQHAFGHGRVTVSLGVACLPDDGTSADDLIAAADRALYDAKRLGRNRVAAP